MAAKLVSCSQRCQVDDLYSCCLINAKTLIHTFLFLLALPHLAQSSEALMAHSWEIIFFLLPSAELQTVCKMKGLKSAAGMSLSLSLTVLCQSCVFSTSRTPLMINFSRRNGWSCTEQVIRLKGVWPLKAVVSSLPLTLSGVISSHAVNRLNMPVARALCTFTPDLCVDLHALVKVCVCAWRSCAFN